MDLVRKTDEERAHIRSRIKRVLRKHKIKMSVEEAGPDDNTAISFFYNDELIADEEEELWFNMFVERERRG